MVKNTTNIPKVVLVAIIVLSFVGIVFYVTEDKRTCAEKNQVDDPSPNKEGGCLDKCIADAWTSALQSRIILRSIGVRLPSANDNGTKK
jgi:hypothetical protein